MNVVDYLFENSKELNKPHVLHPEERSYSDIYKNIMTLAGYIQKNCLLGETVLLLWENSVEFIIGYYAIIKSGCVCVPLDPHSPLSHIEYVIKFCNIQLSIVQEKYSHKFATLSPHNVISTEKLHTLLLGIYEFKEVPIEETNDLAVINFTSGSTGLPRGVMITHANLIENTKSIITYLELQSDEIAEVVLPFNYCYGASVLHTHTRVGGSLVLNNKFLFPETVIKDIQKFECTSFAGVPSTFQILLKATSIRSAKLPSLRYVTQAGGKLADPFIEDLLRVFEGKRIFIMYGQTEATARLSYLPPEKLSSKLGSIGNGIPGVTLEVLNEEGKKVAPEEIGEIVATGKNIMKGYYKDEESTRKVLRDGRLYTGDLAILDEEGYIYVVSRANEIIKSGGVRVSAKEIENALLSLEPVLEAAVIGVPDNIKGEAIYAFVRLNPGKHLSIENALLHCKDQLGPRKVPDTIEIIDILPKNSAGKVQRQELLSLAQRGKHG
jgi:long-chain acyl-CoA synthetase